MIIRRRSGDMSYYRVQEHRNTQYSSPHLATHKQQQQKRKTKWNVQKPVTKTFFFLKFKFGRSKVPRVLSRRRSLYGVPCM